MQDRERTFSWSVVKNYIRKRIVNVENDASQDNEDTIMTDGDI